MNYNEQETSKSAIHYYVIGKKPANLIKLCTN